MDTDTDTKNICFSGSVLALFVGWFIVWLYLELLHYRFLDF